MSHLQAKSANQALVVLKAILNVAVDWGVIEKLPAKITLLRVDEKAPDFYGFEDYERLLTAAKAIDTRTTLVVLLGGDAGLRRGEMIALEWNEGQRTRVLLSHALVPPDPSAWCRGETVAYLGRADPSRSSSKELRDHLRSYFGGGWSRRRETLAPPGSTAVATLAWGTRIDVPSLLGASTNGGSCVGVRRCIRGWKRRWRLVRRGAAVAPISGCPRLGRGWPLWLGGPLGRRVRPHWTHANGAVLQSTGTRTRGG